MGVEVPPLTGWGQRSETRGPPVYPRRGPDTSYLSAPSEVSDEDVGGVAAAGDEEALCCHRVPSPVARCDVSRAPAVTPATKDLELLLLYAAMCQYPVVRQHLPHLHSVPTVHRLSNEPRTVAEMWYWVFLWCLFSSLFVHGAVGLLMLVMLQRHRRGRIITVVMVSVGFLASLSGGVVTSAAAAGVYRVAGKDMAPLEALVLGVGQTTFSVIVSFSRILATL
ncbi:unnamed protein product [Arctogadus glacialis]